MKVKYVGLVAPVALALSVAACGGSTGTSGSTGGGGTAAADCSSADVFCVGLVTDTGKVDDKSFNQAAWDGVQKAAATTGAKTKYIETVDSKDYANNIKQFLDAKYDVVVGVGFNLTQALHDAAKANASTKFIGVDVDVASFTDTPNLTGLIFHEDQAGYLAGMVAGSMTKTNKIGFVGGSKEVPAVNRYGDGYAAGAKAVNPAVTVTTVYHPADGNEFKDSPWGAAEAKKQLDQGVDVIFGAGGGTGNGALGEVAKAQGAGTSKFCIGVDLDQWDTVPEAHPCLITSAMKLETEGTTKLIGQAKDGSIKGGNTYGDIGLAAFHDFDSKVSADVKAKLADATKQLIAGTLKTGVAGS